MNTNNLKRFAKEARMKLLDQVGRKLEFVLTHDTAELRGKQNEIEQLKKKIAEQGKEQVIEMVSYTWFNRLMALRFMDANGYTIPKVITPLEGMTNPEVLQNALGGNIESELKLDRQRLNDLLDGKTAATDAHTEAYKMLLVASCNQWHTAMPFMFERISDYTELLLPDDLLSDYSIVADIRNGMSDEDCQQEELIGWLYQFYIADKKDDVFEGLKKNIKITAENIPAATQLFTPRWIVRYMVENTLGKLWLTLKPNSKLREQMPYYIEAPEGNAPAPLPEGINGVTDITFLDPCQGSGHVLVYAFDLFTKIYEEEGYNTNEIPALILEHNLFGIDIDERAAQLAAFALSMKARNYYSRFLRKPLQPNVISLRNCNFTKRDIERISIPALCEEFKNILTIVKPQQTPYLENELYHLARNEKKELPSNIRALLFDELNNLTNPTFIAALLENVEGDVDLGFDEIFNQGMLKNWLFKKVKFLKSTLQTQFEEYNNLDNFGSLFIPRQANLDLFLEALENLPTNDPLFTQPYSEKINIALFQSEYLSRNYHCVVTNPPYMGIRGMNDELKMFVEKYFPNSKNDLFATFIERCLDFTYHLGYSSLINQHSWMFLSSFQLLRSSILTSHKISSLIHLGPKTFPEIGGEVVQSVSFVLNKGNTQNENSIFYRLVNYKQEGEKEIKFLTRSNIFVFNQNYFSKIPSSPFAYWISNKTLELFGSENNIETYAKPRQGIATSDNNRFLKLWNEVSFSKIDFNKKHDEISLLKWVPLSKGGGNVKWYGLSDYVINWENDGDEIKSYAAKLYGSYTRTIKNISFYFKKHIGWSALSSSGMSARIYPDGYVFGAGGNAAFPDEKYQNVILAFFNSKVFIYLLKIINPTFNLNAGEIAKLPIIESDEIQISELSTMCINISQLYNSTQETSWNFCENHIIQQRENNLSLAFQRLYETWTNKFNELHKSEVKLNELFINLYDLIDELSPDVSLDEITILQEESKIINGELFIDPVLVLLQLLSYSIGCFFGRYSLDTPGLILANQGETLQDFLIQIPDPSFMPDDDNIIPVLEGEWFTDDIVGRFKVFLKAAFGEEHFEENLKYIEETIGKDIRKYFVKDFYNDHIKRYKKRPIYWMFSSPKGHFKALIYMHRYQPDLCSKMLNDYLQAFISKLEVAKQTQTMLSLREDISAREKTIAIKEIDKYEAMLKDCREYEKTLFTIATQKINIDLDDGVKVNYQKFKEVLVTIKGLDKEEE